VLGNLISNAIKFSSRGGTVRIKTFQGPAESGYADLHFAVSDNGIGISDAALAYIFNPFTQADDSTTRRFGGSGLGLSICKQLVELMHGQIWATSKEGVGSTFHFRVRVEVLESSPLAKPAPARTGPISPRPEPSASQAPALEVLLVDDNIVSQKIATAFLRKAGFAVQVAMNGAEALDILRTGRERFMAVLMDCQMPVMSGFEAARAIGLAQATLEIEAAAVLGLRQGLGPAFAQAVERMLRLPGRVVVMGMGKSGHIGRKMAATLACSQPARTSPCSLRAPKARPRLSSRMDLPAPVSPVSTLVIEVAEPLKGTCVIRTPAVSASISMERWVELPIPTLAKVRRSGSARALSTSCATEVMPLRRLAIRTSAVATTGAM
jgi:CheY-like chemotaxis protein